MEAFGSGAFLTASFSILAHEFPDNVATVFVSNKLKTLDRIALIFLILFFGLYFKASLETCFGMGIIAGPLIGGVLYEVMVGKTFFKFFLQVFLLFRYLLFRYR